LLVFKKIKKYIGKLFSSCIEIVYVNIYVNRHVEDFSEDGAKLEKPDKSDNNIEKRFRI